MKLFVTRHGQTNYNEHDLCNADPSVDVHLTAVGIEQAQIVAAKLKDIEFELIVVSPLKRTTQTADIINVYHHVPIVVDERIIDNKTGFEGKPASEYYAARDTAADKWNFRPEGAESLNDVKSRVAAFLKDMRSQQYQSVLVVAHQSVIRLMFGIMQNLTNSEIERLDLAQGEFAEFEL